MMKTRVAMMTAVIAVAVGSTSVQAQADSQVAAAYAQEYSVSEQEAASRLAMLAEINRVEEQLEEKFPNQFGGLYVRHSPKFEIVVKMTGAGDGLLRQVTDNPLFVVEKADVPVQRLTQLTKRAGEALAADGDYYYAVEADIWQGKVHVRTTDAAAARAALEARGIKDELLDIAEVSGGMENTATIYGGRKLTGTTQYCTSGFNVNYNGSPALLTAGHCDNRMTVSGVTFNLVERVYKNSTTWGFDMQVMRPSSTQTYPNEAYKSSTSRETITKVYYAGDIPLDWPLCAYGTTTNKMRCGKLKAKYVQTRDNNGITGVFFRAASDDGNAFVTEGDSGGPVFGTNTAYGIIKGKGDTTYPKDMFFMDIITLEAYGGFTYTTTVKTTP